MDALITNIINNFFVAVWLYLLVPEMKCGFRKAALLVFGSTAVWQLIVAAIIHFISANMLWNNAVMIYAVIYWLAVLFYCVMFIYVISPLRPVKSLFLLFSYFSLWALIYNTVSVVTGTYIGAGNVMIWLLRIGLNLLFLIPYLIFFRNRLFQICQKVKTGFGMITAISSFVFIMMTFLIAYNNRVRIYAGFHIVMMFLIFIFVMMVYVMIFRFIAQSDQANRLKQMQAHEKLLLAQIDSYEKIAENARHTRHDFRHHNLLVMEYAKQRDYQSILDYLKEYEERETEKYENTFCGNHAVDTVMSAYAGRCEQNGIELRADIRLQETEDVSDYDLVTILANILENAVKGCLEAGGDGRLEISVGTKSSKLVIVCKNTCARDILFEDGLPRNKERDGIGVESIISTAAKYNGIVDFYAADGIFVCQVILSNRKKQKN